MGKQRVLLLCNQTLLGESLQAILSGEDGVELIGPWLPNNEVPNRLSEVSPDVVLVAEDEDTGQTTGILTAQILGQHPDLPLVRVGLRENIVRLYVASTMPARSSDLLEAIRRLPSQRPKSSIQT